MRHHFRRSELINETPHPVTDKGENKEVVGVRRRMQIMDELQTMAHPDIFTPRGVYDGKRLFFISNQNPKVGRQLLTVSRHFPLSPTDSHLRTKFNISPRGESMDPRMAKGVHISLAYTTEIQPE